MKKTLIIVDTKARVKDVLRDEEEVLQGVEKECQPHKMGSGEGGVRGSEKKVRRQSDVVGGHKKRWIPRTGEFDEEHEKEKERIRHFLGLPSKKKEVEPAKEELCRLSIH